MRRVRLSWKAILIVSSACLTLVGVLGIARGMNGKATKPVTPGTTETVAKHSAQVDPPPVSVYVTKFVPAPGRSVYRYTVTNGSAFPITDVLIGHDHYAGVEELTYAPMGWDGQTVPSSGYQSPPGWKFRNVAAEEDSVGHLEWSIERPQENILGGASLGGFEVTLDEVDQGYEAGHWTVYLDTSEEPIYSGYVLAGGVTTVPISSVFAKSDLQITPNPARAPVSIRFAVPVAGMASVDIFDAQGRRVKRVLSRQSQVGNASASWDGRDDGGKEVAAGVYFVRVKTQTTTRFARVTWLH